jgi:hypothetical protein
MPRTIILPNPQPEYWDAKSINMEFCRLRHCYILVGKWIGQTVGCPDVYLSGNIA